MKWTCFLYCVLFRRIENIVKYIDVCMTLTDPVSGSVDVRGFGHTRLMFADEYIKFSVRKLGDGASVLTLTGTRAWCVQRNEQPVMLERLIHCFANVDFIVHYAQCALCGKNKICQR